MTDTFAKAIQRLSPTVIALVLANLFPLYGVLALGWEVFPVMLLFWLENVVIGGFNVLKMLLSEPQNPVKWLGKLFIVPFFCVHYGMFTFVHGMFVMGLFGGQFKAGAVSPSVGVVFRLIGEQHLGFAVLALVASHAFSFGWNYLWRGEFRSSSLQGLMAQPYGRVVVLHLAILGGGFLLLALHSPMAGLVVLIVLKIALDVRAHSKEHRPAAQKPALDVISPSPAESTFPQSS